MKTFLHLWLPLRRQTAIELLNACVGHFGYFWLCVGCVACCCVYWNRPLDIVDTYVARELSVAVPTVAILLSLLSLQVFRTTSWWAGRCTCRYLTMIASPGTIRSARCVCRCATSASPKSRRSGARCNLAKVTRSVYPQPYRHPSYTRTTYQRRNTSKSCISKAI